MNGKASCFLRLCLIVGMGNSPTAAAAVHALFDLRTPATGPFPSDQFTVADSSHHTRRRVNLPMPDCGVRRSDCEDLAVINTLDGFNLQPRLSIPFDGPIGIATVTSQTVFLIRLACDGDNDCDDNDEKGGRVLGIDQVVWDTFTNTLHVESNEFLDQYTRYALIVTRGVRDQLGQPVEATEAFQRFRQTVRGEYRQALLEAIHAARRIGVRESEIVTASVFTTQTATSILEKIRDQIKAATPEPADFRLGPGGTRTVFARDQVTRITFNQQTRVDGPLVPVRVLDELLDIFPGAVGTVAFGKYNSPDYEVHPGEFIPPVGTRTGTPSVRGTNEIYFNLFLPSGRKPDAGWPVAIFGHGLTQNKNFAFNVAAKMAAHGIATIAINAIGHGFGPRGTLTVNQTGGEPVTFSAGGRGIDQNGDHVIESNEGFSTAPPRTIIFVSDGVRQTVADLMQLVQVTEVGLDVDADGSQDLDPSRIYYFGPSLGGNYGTNFLSIDPSVRAGVLNVVGGPIIDNRRLGPGSRSSLGQSFSSRIPPLINAPGIMSLDGILASPPRFNENFPLRDGIPLRVQLADGISQNIQSPVINTVAGAISIQEVVKNTEWVGQPGSPAAYAPHLRRDLLPGVPVKSVIFQVAKGDQGAPNPNATAVVRAGDLADRTTFYRHDIAFADDPRLPNNPHPFLIRTDSLAFRPICLAAQEQVAVFFATDGETIIQPEPSRYFEVPIVLPLPEALNFIPPR